MYATESPALDALDELQLDDLERWGSLAVGAILIAFGLHRRSIAGLCLAISATPFAYRGLTGEWPAGLSLQGVTHDETRMALAGSRGIHVRSSIRLEKPVADVFRFWRRLENLPQFMAHLERVTELSDTLSHWIAKAPAGTTVEWDAEIINEIENKVLAWRSVGESAVVTAGSVTFQQVRGGRSTQLSVRLQYAPPFGRLGAFAATLTGREPSQTIREDLRRFKQLLEAGEIARASSEDWRGGIL